MSPGKWPAPRRVAEQVGLGWGGLWSLLHTAELAVAALALMSPPEESLRLRLVGDQLRATAQSLATDYPAQVAAAVAIDLGPIADRSHVPAACDMVVQLLSAVLRDCNDLFGYDLDIGDNALLARVDSAARDARDVFIGGSDS